jgi:hypothetical protein
MNLKFEHLKEAATTQPTAILQLQLTNAHRRKIHEFVSTQELFSID